MCRYLLSFILHIFNLKQAYLSTSNKKTFVFLSSHFITFSKDLLRFSNNQYYRRYPLIICHWVFHWDNLREWISQSNLGGLSTTCLRATDLQKQHINSLHRRTFYLYMINFVGCVFANHACCMTEETNICFRSNAGLCTFIIII